MAGESGLATDTLRVRLTGKAYADAAELSVDHDAVDALHERLFVVLLDPSWPHGVGPATDAAQLGRWHERYADHAVNAGRRVIYFVTGQPHPARN